MKLSLVEMLRCTAGCDSRLNPTVYEEIDAGSIANGYLECTGCGRQYPIEGGILRMLPENLVAECDCSADSALTSKRSEMQARDDQVEDYDKMWYLNLFGMLEIPLTLKNLSLEKEHTLLEAGCGTGRMTREFAARCTRLVSIDFSFESLRACASKLRASGVQNVDLIQADICHLPLKTESFQRVVSCQVLEHIPTPECRLSAVQDLARVLQPGGQLVISAYQYSLLMRLFGQKEGEHAGGIYFYRFTYQEFRKLLAQALQVEAITGAMVYHYIARCRK